MSNPKPEKIYKETEFATFLSLLADGGASGHWAEIANAIGVSPDTITSWRKRPEAIEAQTKGIVDALHKMEESGAKDWRMWESKLKMLGLSPVNKLEIGDTSTVEKLLAKYGLGDGDVGQTQETKG